MAPKLVSEKCAGRSVFILFTASIALSISWNERFIYSNSCYRVYLKDDGNGEPKVIYGLFEVCSKISGQCRKFTDHTIDSCVVYGTGNTMDGFRCTEWKILRVVAEMNVFFVFLLFCGSILAGCRLGPYTEGWRIFQFFIAAMCKWEKNWWFKNIWRCKGSRRLFL